MSTSVRPLQVFVTVGMGPWPFDRLLQALAPVCSRHDVFVQRGNSSVPLTCPSADFLGWSETQRRLREADVVITHAGNTVRLVQRMGKIPIAIARESTRGEMRNDHQVEYLARERATGRMIALEGSLSELLDIVEQHPETEARMLAELGALPAVDDSGLARLLTDQLTPPSRNPFSGHSTRRYAWAFGQLGNRAGVHLDLGCGDGTFAKALHRHSALRVIGADAHPGYLAELNRQADSPPIVQMRDRIPLQNASVDSVSMLDSLEHVPDETAMLGEVHRVLRPGGIAVITVPARHVFSMLDPDNAKFRAPRLHAAVYRARFGKQAYRRRFLELDDQLRGDLAANRSEHTNYVPAELITLLDESGFTVDVRDGANLFWRFLQVPQLLLPESAARLLDAPLRADGLVFHHANLFLRAVRRSDSS